MIRKLLLLAAFVAIFAGPAFAVDRVHLITVESITVAGADADVGNMANLIALYSETTKSNQGTVFNKIRQTAQQGNRDRILQAVDEMRGKVAKNDIVLVYYSGHGAIDNQGAFLQLDDESHLYRQELMQKMRSVGGRLHLLITDCCAVEVPPKKTVQMRAAFVRPDAERTQRLVDNCTRLLKSSGVIDLNGAAPKQVAWGAGGGGLFTKTLVKTLYDKNVSDWPGLHKTVVAETEQEYTKFRTDGLSDNGQRLNLGEEDLTNLKNQTRQTPHLFTFALAGVDTGRPPATGGNTKPPPATGGNTNPPRLPPLIGGGDDGPPTVPPVKPPMRGAGVFVTRVFPETAATSLNLKGENVRLDVGDRIVEVNGVPIRSAAQFHTILDKMEKDATFRLLVIDRNTRKAFEVSGQLDVGGGFRFGTAVEEK